LQYDKIQITRYWRIARALPYLVLIIIVVPIIFSPLANKLTKRRQIASFLYRRFYTALNIQLIIEGSPTSKPALWVCNHISWLDILLLAGNSTVDFIAKTEVGKWPIIGYIVKKAGTLLISRENKFQTYRSLPLLQKRIRTGIPMIVFPEGTTTNGYSTLPFKPMFYQAAIREDAMIQPLSLQYFDSNGDITDCVAFVDDDDFITSLKQILKQPKIIARLHFLPAITASEYHRKQLASISRLAIDQDISLNDSARFKSNSNKAINISISNTSST